MWDRETGSIWDHITGECVYGPLRGTKLPIFNLLHMSVEQALVNYPDLRLAISDRPIRRRRGRFSPLGERVPVLSRLFRSTIAEEDTRRPTMDIGLGVWTSGSAHYYPMDDVLAHDNYVIDEFEGRRLLVYFDPTGHALGAFYTEATEAVWDGDELRLNTGDVMSRGALFDAEGKRRDIERPLQLFTRWYGFALTFPETDIYEP